MTPLVLGQKAFVTGDVTTNNRVGARSARDLETSLGFGPGRLSAGWWILLLKRRLTSTDFVFSGLTSAPAGGWAFQRTTRLSTSCARTSTTRC